MEDFISTQSIENTENNKNDVDEFLSIIDLTQKADVIIDNTNNNNSNSTNEKLEKRLSNIESIQNTILNENKTLDGRLKILEDQIKSIINNSKITEDNSLKQVTEYNTKIENQMNSIQQILNDIDQLKAFIKLISDISSKVNTMNQNIIDINTQISSMKNIPTPDIPNINTQIETISKKVELNTGYIKKCENNTSNFIKALSSTIAHEKRQTDIQINSLWNSITLIIQRNE